VGEILGIGRIKFHEGKFEAFKRLAAQAMEIVRTMDSGTLQYDIFLNNDQSECIVIERYQDSAAVMMHGSHIGDLVASMFATGSASSEMLGEPSGELRAMMAGGEVRVFTPFLSM
jgi:quinol monooxygenase YgiN